MSIERKGVEVRAKCDVSSPDCSRLACVVTDRTANDLRRCYGHAGWHYWNQLDCCGRCWQWLGAMPGQRRAQRLATLQKKS